MPTKINETGAIAKVRILLNSDTVRYLKTFKVISNEMPISFILC